MTKETIHYQIISSTKSYSYLHVLLKRKASSLCLTGGFFIIVLVDLVKEFIIIPITCIEKIREFSLPVSTKKPPFVIRNSKFVIIS